MLASFRISALSTQHSALKKPSCKIAFALVAALLLSLGSSPARASSHYTLTQLEAFDAYTDKTYWITADDEKLPAFRSAPSPSAPPFKPGAKESFKLEEIVGGKGAPYYYRAVFESGKTGFLAINSFLDGLNLTILTVDPDRDRKRKIAKEAEEESQRQAWIRKQPWPEQVKQAALERRPALGMTTGEARAILGKPKNVFPLQNSNPLLGKQEQWLYENGQVLTFTNGLLTRVQAVDKPAQ